MTQQWTFLLSWNRIINKKKYHVGYCYCGCNPQSCLSNDFPPEKTMLVPCWEKNWACTACANVNVDYSWIKNSHSCLFSCGDVIWNQCIKDRPHVFRDTIESNVAPREVVPPPNVFCHKCPESKNRCSRRSEMPHCTGGDDAEVIFLCEHLKPWYLFI